MCIFRMHDYLHPGYGSNQQEFLEAVQDRCPQRVSVLLEQSVNVQGMLIWRHLAKHFLELYFHINYEIF